MVGKYLIATFVFATLVAAKLPFSVPRVENISNKLTEPFQAGPSVSYRLPNNTRPVSYDVQLTTHIHTQTDFSFTGNVAVRFVTIETSNTIVLHQRQLTIGVYSLHLATSPDVSIPLNTVEYDGVTEFLKFTLTSGSLIENNEYVLSIAYNGTLRNDPGGFYRSSYTADDGATRYLFSNCVFEIYI